MPLAVVERPKHTVRATFEEHVLSIEQVSIRTRDGQCPFILPTSGMMSKFIIAGIPVSGAGFACSASSSAHQGGSIMSRGQLAQS